MFETRFNRCKFQIVTAVLSEAASSLRVERDYCARFPLSDLDKTTCVVVWGGGGGGGGKHHATEVPVGSPHAEHTRERGVWGKQSITK